METKRLTMAALLGMTLTAASACGGGDGDGACDPTAEACVLENTLSTVTAAAGSEDEDLCQSWTLDNPTELWVSSITQENGGAYHHANWFFVPDNTYEYPDGAWSCREAEFSELEAAIIGGYLFAMSTQSRLETQAFPAGGAIRIPPYSRIVAASHILNASDQPVTTEMRIEIHTVPPTEVEAKLVPARLTYRALNLDANAKSSFTTECLLDQKHIDVVGRPLELELFYVLSHYHALGRYAQLEIAGGPRDGEVIFRSDGFGENFGRAYDPPFDLAAAGGLGLRFTCGFDNPRNEVVGWGVGDQEMCVMALMSRTDLGFDGTANSGAQVGVGGDGEIHYEGLCDLLGLPWNHDKPGGPKR